ncbi:MAG: protein-L-isoaspartate(D-aspartate) O-methyltransferase [Gammaproteobacteria bacterium]|nr:protein-L-isoaspartate(D-aspartate) O-methyltransferase [Gammaproteobacteria bacterium]
MFGNIKRMLADIQSEVNYTRSYIGKDALDERVMDAMARVPRDEFVPDKLKKEAFNNGPLPIGYNQTISQPYIVALMTDLLDIKPEHRVLEIGTGCGYQTAILSRLCAEVYTMERIAELSHMAIEHFIKLKYKNIETTIGNGYDGWPEHAPYDGIVVTASASHIPDALTEQLKPGGNLVIPIGLEHMHQELLLVKKDLNSEITVDSILPVAFVPLIDDKMRHQGNSTLH